MTHDDPASEKPAPPGSGAARDRHWGKFSTNVLANLGQFGVQILIGFWFVPYLVRHLGAAGYGLIPLTLQLTVTLRIVTQALSSTVGRFLTIALERNDDEDANRIFNTAVIGNLVLTLLIVPPGLWVTMHAEHIFSVPAGLEGEAQALFTNTLGMFMLMTVAHPFTASTYARNRFDLRTAIIVCASIGRVVSIVLLFSLTGATLWHAGVGNAVLGLITFIGSVIVWRYLTPQLKLGLEFFSRSRLRNLVDMAGWVLVNQVGTILSLNFNLLIVNRLFGAIAGGHYAIALQWATLLRAMSSGVAEVFAPTMLSLYAKNDIDGLVHYARRAVRIMGLMMSLPVGLVCGLSSPLLNVWVGEEFVFLAPLMSLLTIHMAVNLAYLPVHTISVAANRMKVPGIVTLALGFVYLGLALILAKPVGWGMYGVAAAGAIVSTAKSLFFTAIYNAHILGRPRGTFLREMLPTTASALSLVGAGWFLSSAWMPSSWPELFLLGAPLALVYCGLIWLVFLSDEERHEFKRVLLRRP